MENVCYICGAGASGRTDLATAGRRSPAGGPRRPGADLVTCLRRRVDGPDVCNDGAAPSCYAPTEPT